MLKLTIKTPKRRHSLPFWDHQKTLFLIISGRVRMISSLLLTLKYFAPISSVAIVGFELVNVCWVFSENYFLVWKFCGKAQFPHRNCETMRKLPFHKISTPANSFHHTQQTRTFSKSGHHILLYKLDTGYMDHKQSRFVIYSLILGLLSLHSSFK